VEYIGKKIKKDGKDSYILFKVEFEARDVKVKPAQGSNEVRMSYDAFLDWVGYNKFEPYTEEQYQYFKQFLDREQKDAKGVKGGWIQFFSIAALVGSFKSIWDNWMAQIKERQEFESTKLYYMMLSSSFAKGVGTIFGEAFRDVIADAFSEYDAKIWSVINKYKEQLTREGGVDSGIAIKKIKKDIFDKYK